MRAQAGCRGAGVQWLALGTGPGPCTRPEGPLWPRPMVRGKVAFGSPEAKGLGSRGRPWSRPTCSPLVPPQELFVTEASHVRTLRVLDLVFHQRLRKEGLLSREELARLFPNLPELVEAHSEPPTPAAFQPPQLPRAPGPGRAAEPRPLGPPPPDCWCEAMRKLRDEGPVVGEVGDLMLARVRCGPHRGGGAGRAGPGRCVTPGCCPLCLSSTAPPGRSCSEWPPSSAPTSRPPWSWSRPSSARTAGSSCSCRCAAASPAHPAPRDRASEPPWAPSPLPEGGPEPCSCPAPAHPPETLTGTALETPLLVAKTQDRRAAGLAPLPAPCASVALPLSTDPSPGPSSPRPHCPSSPACSRRRRPLG